MVTPDGIQWYHQYKLITDSDMHYTFSEDKLSLYIDHLLLSDGGNYTLVAMNAAGSGRATIFLDIAGMKQIVIIKTVTFTVL